MNTLFFSVFSFYESKFSNMIYTEFNSDNMEITILKIICDGVIVLMEFI